MSGRPSFCSAGLVLLFVVLGCAPRALAQSCHQPTLRSDEGSSWRTSVSGTFASYANASYTGEYQGVHVNAAYAHPRASVQLALPYYRIVRNGLPEHGFGDVGADLRAVAVQTDDGALRFGPELALTAPSGDATKDLGMGHFMVMPGVWLRWAGSNVVLIAQLAYGRAAGEMHGMAHHHGGSGPIVNPMNQSELEHAFSLAYVVHQRLQLLGRLWGALPVADTAGTAREVLALGLQALAGPVDLSLEVQLPLVGTPFRERLILTAGSQW